MTRCATCGGRTQSAERIKTEYQGERYEFCSDECKGTFESRPEEFVG